MSSDFLDGYTPSTPTSFARPVQDESATAGLSGCETPDGHGVLLWALGGAIHCAVVASPLSFLVNDVVPLADVRVVASGKDNIFGTGVFVTGGELYCHSHEHTSNVCSVRIYKADDPNNPVTWTVQGTAYSASIPTGGYFGNPTGGVLPLILDSGRWVMSCKACVAVGTTNRGVHFRVFTSEDQGATWTSRLNYSHPYPGFPRVEHCSGQVATDPVTGYLWTNSGTSVSGPTYMNVMWYSTDNGSTWTAGTGGSWFTDPHHIPAIQNGTNVYAISNYGIYVYDGSGVALSDWVGTGEAWWAPGITHDNPNQPTQRTAIASQGVFFFVLDQVMLTPAGGVGAWHFNVHWST